MATIAVTPGQVAPVDPDRSIIKTFIAAAAISKGQPLYCNTSGKVAPADADAAGAEQFIGIALNKAVAGQAVDVLMEGPIAGFDLDAVAYNGAVFLSDTVGSLDTAAGTKTVRVGRCLPMSDNALTKILYIDCNLAQVW